MGTRCTCSCIYFAQSNKILVTKNLWCGLPPMNGTFLVLGRGTILPTHKTFTSISLRVLSEPSHTSPCIPLVCAEMVIVRDSCITPISLTLYLTPQFHWENRQILRFLKRLSQINVRSSQTYTMARISLLFHNFGRCVSFSLFISTFSVPNPYLDKEVQGYYEDGMRVPDDVCLLWTDDKWVISSSRWNHTILICESWGNVRRFPTADERNRTGGAGIYYHVSCIMLSLLSFLIAL